MNGPAYPYRYFSVRFRRMVTEHVQGMDEAHANERAIVKFGRASSITRTDTGEVIWRRKSERSQQRAAPITVKEIPMSRFTKLDAKGKDLPKSATDHVAVRDNTTGLIWQAGDSEKSLTHKQAEAYAKKLRLLGKKDWRLPTVEELFLLADRSKSNPAIDKDFFPTCKSSWYWSGTLYAASPAGYAWIVNFGDGYSSWSLRDYDYYVRAVRPGQ